jgi:hypothetical protein
MAVFGHFTTFFHIQKREHQMLSGHQSTVDFWKELDGSKLGGIDKGHRSLLLISAQ